MNPRPSLILPPTRGLALFFAVSAAAVVACAPSDGVEPADEPTAVTAYYVGVDDVGERGVMIDLTLADTLYVFDERLLDADLTGVTLLCPNGVFMNMEAWLGQQLSFGTVTFDRRRPGPFVVGSTSPEAAQRYLDEVVGGVGPEELEAFGVAQGVADDIAEVAAQCACTFSCALCPDGAVLCSLRCRGCTDAEEAAMMAYYEALGLAAGLVDTEATCFGGDSECKPTPMRPLPGGDPSPIDDGWAPTGGEPGAGGGMPSGGEPDVGGATPGGGDATPGGGGEPGTGGAMPGGDGAPSGGSGDSGGSGGSGGSGSGTSGGGFGGSGGSNGGSGGSSGGNSGGGSAGQPW